MQPIPAIRVDGRYFGRTLPFLNMYVDTDELPDPADREDGRADAYWVSGVSLFQGMATPLVAGESIAAPAPIRLDGITAIAETDDSFFVVVTGYRAVEPAVWLVLPRGAAAAALDGGAGGPTLSLETADWRLELQQVGRLLRHSGSHQRNQERALAQALARTPTQQRSAPTIPTTPYVASDARVDAAHGYFVQSHEAGLTTSLVDPTDDRASSLNRLLAAEWLPLNVLARQYRLTVGGIGSGWPAAPRGVDASPTAE